VSRLCVFGGRSEGLGLAFVSIGITTCLVATIVSLLIFMGVRVQKACSGQNPEGNKFVRDVQEEHGTEPTFKETFAALLVAAVELNNKKNKKKG